MDPGTISLCISGAVAVIQGLNFISNRRDKKDDRLKDFVKKEEFSGLKHLEATLAAKIITLHTDIEVLKNKVDNEIHITSKSLDKLDKHIDQLLGIKCKTE